MAQQGFPPGRHSRDPYPGDAPHQDAPYGDDSPYPDAPYPDQGPLGETVHASGYGQRPDSGLQPEYAPRPDAGAQPEYAPQPDSGVQPEYAPQPDSGVRPDSGGRPGRGGHPDRARRADRHRPGGAPWQQTDPFAPASDTDTGLPPWAGPAVYPGRPTVTVRRLPAPRRRDDTDYREPADDTDRSAAQVAAGAEGETRIGRRRGRAAAARLRKSRRRVYRWCGAAIAVCVVAAGIVAILTHNTAKPAPYVTSLQHGEFTSVPNACTSVGASVLNQYLPGSGRTSTSTQSSSTNSQCSFTIDSKPNFLVLEVQAQSYQPFAAAARDGSATGNAQDNIALAQFSLAHPAKKSPLPPAQISSVAGLGQQAFMAFQHAHVAGIVTDIVTVVIRERNVVVTASLSGQESGHGFGPVPVATLQAGARAAAQAVLAKVMTGPTV